MDVLADYQNIRINRYNVDKGAATPSTREILLERITARELGLDVGDKITVEIDNERRYELTVAGIIHDVYILPMTIFGDAFVISAWIPWNGWAKRPITTVWIS